MSTSALDSLVMEVSESHPLFSNFLQLALVVVCPSASVGRTSVLEVLQPFSVTVHCNGLPQYVNLYLIRSYDSLYCVTQKS